MNRDTKILSTVIALALASVGFLTIGAGAQSSCPITTTQPPLIDSSLCNALSATRVGPNAISESIKTQVIWGRWNGIR